MRGDPPALLHALRKDFMDGTLEILEQDHIPEFLIIHSPAVGIVNRIIPTHIL